MRRIVREALSAEIERDLHSRQTRADRKHAAGTLNPAIEWKAARKTKPLKAVERTLKIMMGVRERCMYCLDSHGSDIEHFWPKTPYPERMFRWTNLLLCCAECGRLKGDDFPLDNGTPLLIDPTAEDPWEYLDFDPVTGTVVARFDPTTNAWTKKGEETVNTLRLNAREALSADYVNTYRRIVDIIDRAIKMKAVRKNTMLSKLRNVDDHGLLGWCFKGAGKDETPFSELRRTHPRVWEECSREIL